MAKVFRPFVRARNVLRDVQVASGRRRIRQQGYTARPTGSGYGYTSLMGGGIVNPQTGMGGTADKTEHAFFTPTRIWNRTPFEVIYAQSWATRKAINLPIDDGLQKWRTWKSESESTNNLLVEVEKMHGVKSALRRAMRAGALYGSSLLCMVTKEAPLESELRPEQIRMGDLVALRVFDRFSCYVSGREFNVLSPDYGPTMYHVFPKTGQQFDIHPSRVVRFDGQRENSDDGYTVYDYDWGISELIPAILAVMEDQTIATAMAHLAQVASIPVLSVEGLRETIMSPASTDANEASAQQIGEQINNLMSVFRLLMLEKGTEEFTRVAVQFSGIADVQDRATQRLAAAFDIPMTRFNGQPPKGMNATGESDLENYYMMCASKRDDKLEDSGMSRFDMVIAREAGLSEVPEYEWAELLEPKPKDIAETAKLKAEAGNMAVQAGAISEDDLRTSLDGDPFFGTLTGDAPGLPQPDFEEGGPPSSGKPPKDDKKPAKGNGS